jgi:hypothetical protein
MNRVLVIGATGTVGRQVVSQLVVNGVPARAMVRNPAAAALPPQVEVVRGVKRARSSQDRRESVARITDKGLALLVAVDQSVSKEGRLIGNCLKPREWAMGNAYTVFPASLSFDEELTNRLLAVSDKVQQAIFPPRSRLK